MVRICIGMGCPPRERKMKSEGSHLRSAKHSPRDASSTPGPLFRSLLSHKALR